MISAIGIQHTMFVPAVLLTGLIVLARVMPDTAAPTDSAVESAP